MKFINKLYKSVNLVDAFNPYIVFKPFLRNFQQSPLSYKKPTLASYDSFYPFMNKWRIFTNQQTILISISRFTDTYIFTTCFSPLNSLDLISTTISGPKMRSAVKRISFLRVMRYSIILMKYDEGFYYLLRYNVKNRIQLVIHKNILNANLWDIIKLQVDYLSIDFIVSSNRYKE